MNHDDTQELPTVQASPYAAAVAQMSALIGQVGRHLAKADDPDRLTASAALRHAGVNLAELENVLEALRSRIDADLSDRQVEAAAVLDDAFGAIAPDGAGTAESGSNT
ncbi:hypothetical protein [Salininema proteolyticum]|uniref:DUF1844 domain-containing protein n=1 Tax=Salininema proteolyticum TaxID=1607685 RepID=A0ABV8TX74_9ACTN